MILIVHSITEGTLLIILLISNCLAIASLSSRYWIMTLSPSLSQHTARKLIIWTQYNKNQIKRFSAFNTPSIGLLQLKFRCFTTTNQSSPLLCLCATFTTTSTQSSPLFCLCATFNGNILTPLALSNPIYYLTHTGPIEFSSENRPFFLPELLGSFFSGSFADLETTGSEATTTL